MKTPYMTETNRVLAVALELYRSGKIRPKTYQAICDWVLPIKELENWFRKAAGKGIRSAN